MSDYALSSAPNVPPRGGVRRGVGGRGESCPFPDCHGILCRTVRYNNNNNDKGKKNHVSQVKRGTELRFCLFCRDHQRNPFQRPKQISETQNAIKATKYILILIEFIVYCITNNDYRYSRFFSFKFNTRPIIQQYLNYIYIFHHVYIYRINTL